MLHVASRYFLLELHAVCATQAKSPRCSWEVLYQHERKGQTHDIFSNQWELWRNFECWSKFFSHYFWCQFSPLEAVPWVTAATGQQNNTGGHQRGLDICCMKTSTGAELIWNWLVWHFLPTSFSVTMDLSGDGVGMPCFFFFKVYFLNFW